MALVNTKFWIRVTQPNGTISYADTSYTTQTVAKSCAHRLDVHANYKDGTSGTPRAGPRKPTEHCIQYEVVTDKEKNEETAARESTG